PISNATDTVAPTTTAWFAGNLGANGWYTGPVTVTIEATDVLPGSGIANTLYRVDGGDWLRYVAPFTIATTGIHRLEYYSTDNDASRAYGVANPAFTASYSGFLNGETLATSGVTGSPTLTSFAAASSAPKTYAIVTAPGSLAAANYTFKVVYGTLTVTPAPL